MAKVTARHRRINKVKAAYPNGACPDCNTPIPDDVANGSMCVMCGHTFFVECPVDDVREHIGGKMAKMELVALTAKHSTGEVRRLYGYPVIQEGETVGIVVPSGRERGKIYHAYRLVGGVITDSYSYRTRKEAFAFFTPKTESTSLEAVKIMLSLAIAVETVLARIDNTNIHTTIGEMKDTWQILRDAL